MANQRAEHSATALAPITVAAPAPSGPPFRFQRRGPQKIRLASAPHPNSEIFQSDCLWDYPHPMRAFRGIGDEALAFFWVGLQGGPASAAFREWSADDEQEAPISWKMSPESVWLYLDAALALPSPAFALHQCPLSALFFWDLIII